MMPTAIPIIAAVVAAAGTGYSMYEGNKAQQQSRDNAKAAAKAQAAQLAAQRMASRPLPQTPGNFPGISSQIMNQIMGLEASTGGGLSPSYLSSQGAIQSGNAGFTDLAQEVITNALGGH